MALRQMRENPLKHKNNKKTDKILALPDILTTCPKCGGEVGIWSEEAKTLCVFCEHRVFEKEGTIH